LAVKIGSSNGWLRVALEAVALVFTTRGSFFPLGFLDLPIFLPTIYRLILAGLVLYMTYRGVSLIIGFVEYYVLKPQPILTGASTLQMLAYILYWR